MIAGIFYQSSGLGNQLHRYIATRVLALDKGYGFGMAYVPNDPSKEGHFKGQSFMDIDHSTEWGKNGLFVVPSTMPKRWNEKKVVENGVDIRSYDPEFNFVEDNTLIDGEFQDERYFKHRLKEVNDWLEVDRIEIPDDVCVIGFRGGEYYVFPELGLSKEFYYEDAIKRMREINSNMKFEVHTDDVPLATQFFPDFKITHDIGINWRSVRFAKHAIIANSSFYIIPRLLRHWSDHAITIAPRYWARRNVGFWALPQNYYKDFQYI